MHTPALNPLRSLVIAIAVLGGALISDGTASASCGDYLTVKNPKPGTATPAAEMPDGHGGEHSPKAPCHGPNCSLGRVPDQTPISSTPFKLSPPVTDPAALDTRADDTATTRTDWQRVSDRSATVSRPFAPFHPPKSV